MAVQACPEGWTPLEILQSPSTAKYALMAAIHIMQLFTVWILFLLSNLFSTSKLPWSKDWNSNSEADHALVDASSSLTPQSWSFSALSFATSASFNKADHYLSVWHMGSLTWCCTKRYVPTSDKLAGQKKLPFYCSMQWKGFSLWETCMQCQHNGVVSIQSLYHHVALMSWSQWWHMPDPSGIACQLRSASRRLSICSTYCCRYVILWCLQKYLYQFKFALINCCTHIWLHFLCSVALVHVRHGWHVYWTFCRKGLACNCFSWIIQGDQYCFCDRCPIMLDIWNHPVCDSLCLLWISIDHGLFPLFAFIGFCGIHCSRDSRMSRLTTTWHTSWTHGEHEALITITQQCVKCVLYLMVLNFSMPPNLTQNPPGHLTHVYNSQEHAVIDSFKTQYIVATLAAARKTIAQVHILPVLFNHWEHISEAVSGDQMQVWTMVFVTIPSLYGTMDSIKNIGTDQLGAECMVCTKRHHFQARGLTLTDGYTLVDQASWCFYRDCHNHGLASRWHQYPRVISVSQNCNKKFDIQNDRGQEGQAEGGEWEGHCQGFAGWYSAEVSGCGNHACLRPVSFTTCIPKNIYKNLFSQACRGGMVFTIHNCSQAGTQWHRTGVIINHCIYQ